MSNKFLFLAIFATFVAFSAAALTFDCKEEADTDFEGHDIPGISSKPTSSSPTNTESCRQLCQTTDNCAFFTFNDHGKVCSLKTSDAGRKAHKGSTSGPRDCEQTASAPVCQSNPDGTQSCVGR